MIKEGDFVKIVRDKSLSMVNAHHFLKKGAVVVVATAKTFEFEGRTYQQYVVDAYGKDFIAWDDRSHNPSKRYTQAISIAEFELVSHKPVFLEEKNKTGKLPNI